MQIEVVYSNSMKINKGNYEQENPFYSAKTVLTLPEQTEWKDMETAYKANYEQLKAIVEPLLQADYNAKRTDLANVRIREKDGKKYPSVTSILNPDGMSKKIKNLEQYSARGNEADRIFKDLMTTGVTKEVDKSKFPDLEWTYDIKEFIKSNKLLKKLEMPLWKKDIEVFNEEWMYSGEIDLLFDDNLIFDIKTGAYKWEQLVAYAKCNPNWRAVQIADLKDSKVVGHNIVDPEMQKAWENFLVKRGEFKCRFGI
jgi:hypothetical protein